MVQTKIFLIKCLCDHHRSEKRLSSTTTGVKSFFHAAALAKS